MDAGWMHGSDAQMDDGWVHEFDAWMGEWMDGWIMDGWMSGWKTALCLHSTSDFTSFRISFQRKFPNKKYGDSSPCDLNV